MISQWHTDCNKIFSKYLNITIDDRIKFDKSSYSKDATIVEWKKAKSESYIGCILQAWFENIPQVKLMHTSVIYLYM